MTAEYSKLIRNLHDARVLSL